MLALEALARASKSGTFWLLFGTFFVCGATTNGLVGTHLIAYCGDHGIAPVAAAGLLSTMGIFDLFGTTASGWLTDRFDPRRLLFVYYGLRGLSLIVLPFLDFGPIGLGVFAVFYGLDWIATVPPRWPSPTAPSANARPRSSSAGSWQGISLARPARRWGRVWCGRSGAPTALPLPERACWACWRRWPPSPCPMRGRSFARLEEMAPSP
jgi:predicted MFS family arabinose efflux permease